MGGGSWSGDMAVVTVGCLPASGSKELTISHPDTTAPPTPQWMSPRDTRIAVSAVCRISLVSD